MNCPHVCTIKGQTLFQEDSCLHPLCTMLSCQCGLLYIFIIQTGCVPVLEMQRKWPPISDKYLPSNIFMCDDKKEINMEHNNDLFPDCSQSEDENEYIELLKIRKSHIPVSSNKLCIGEGNMSCVVGHSKCFPQNRLCVFDHDSDESLRYCRNGAYLEYCEYFQNLPRKYPLIPIDM